MKLTPRLRALRVAAPPPSPGATPGAALRLWIARTLAWSLLLSGWLVLGALGRQHALLLVSGYAPLALWLACTGALLVGTAFWPLSRGVLAAVLMGAGGLTVLALHWADRGAPALALAALGWSVLLVAASRCVRSLRTALPRLPPAPLVPALLGGSLAWGVAGDLPALPTHTVALSVALLATAVALALLVPRGVGHALGCRAGLFDCSLPVPALVRWRNMADWPLHAASLTMLPMMTALPAMADWCSAAGWSAPMVTGLHLAAMLLPPALLQRALPSVSASQLRRWVALLLAVGALLLVAWPGVQGLMAASLWHALAWGVAWAGPMVARTPVPAAPSKPWGAGMGHQLAAVALAGSAVLALGAGIGAAGPAALTSAHAGLALLGLLGLLLAPALRHNTTMDTKEFGR